MSKKPFAKWVIALTFASSLLFAIIGCSQHTSAQERRPPFRMELLAGYNLRETDGTDTRTGVISKRGALRIQYDMAGDLPSNTERKIKPAEQWIRQCAWKKNGYPDPALDKSDIVCWFDVDDSGHHKTLHVSFPDLTTFWTKVRNQRQTDEALKMILTYDPRR